MWDSGRKDVVRGTVRSVQQGAPVTLLDPDILESQGSALFAPV
jgi:hypothetical protein